MKKIFLVIVGILTSMLSFSQNAKINPVELSNAEKFASTPNVLIKGDFIDIGKVELAPKFYRKDSIVIRSVNYTDLTNKKSIMAIRVQKELIGAFLDKDEIEAIIKSIKYINENVLQNPPKNYCLYIFKSKTGCEIGVVSVGNQWEEYISMGGSMFTLSSGGLSTLSNILLTAKL